MKPQEILKVAREKSGETQEVIAGKIGVSLRMYQRYEEGKFPKYRSDSIEKLDKLFGTHIYGILYDKAVRNGQGPPPDPTTVMLPNGDVKRTLADYINMLELYNRTLSGAINAGLIELKESLKSAETNLAQGQLQLKEQVNAVAINLEDMVSELPAKLKESKRPVSNKDKTNVDQDGSGDRKDKDH